MANPIKPRKDFGPRSIILEVLGLDNITYVTHTNPDSIDNQFDAWFRLNHPRRADCGDRGYHLISSLRQEDPQVCYHCELFFGQDEGTKYKIDPSYTVPPKLRP